MKRPYRNRWWHDRDVVEFAAAVALGGAALAVLLWCDWRATAPQQVLPEARSEERGARSEEPEQILPAPQPPAPSPDRSLLAPESHQAFVVSR